MKQPAPGGMTCETAQRLIALRAMAHKPLPVAGLESVDEPEFQFSEFLGEPGAPDTLGDLSAALLAGEPSEAEGETMAGGSITPSSLHGGSTAAGALEQHLQQCRACQAEMTATDAFFRALAAERLPEPSPTLLARARMQLDATLDSCEQAGLWTRLARRFSFGMGRLRAAPVLSSALLFLGLLAGGYGGYRMGVAAHNSDQAALLLAPPPTDAPSIIADVSSIQADPATGMVEVRYDRLVPDVLTAAEGDPSMRELLMAGAENGVDPGVRDTSLGLLGRRCSAGSACEQPTVRAALLNALATDKAPEVRREALAELQPFITEDVGVRDAVLNALMDDPSASVRIEAVRMLQPVDVDSSVRQVLHTVADRDGDPQIRVASMRVLKTMPDLQ